MAMNPRRIVVFGGTFDPVHNGHIAIAKCLRDELNPASIVMVPSGRPWLRSKSPVASPSDRLRMVKLAVQNEKQIEVSDVDVARNKTTYSIDTIRDLRSRYGTDCDFVLAIGADAVPDLHRWHRYEELVEECSFVIVQRPGSPLADTTSLPLNTSVIQGPMLNISASSVRSMVERGQFINTTEVLPELVLAFIIEKGLYQ